MELTTGVELHWEILYNEVDEDTGFLKRIRVESAREARLVLGFFRRMGISSWADEYINGQWKGMYGIHHGELYCFCS